jgi:hypothetical protein
MFRSNPMDKAIEAAAKLKAALSSLLAAYQELLKIIDAEHAAISRSDLVVIEELVLHKDKSALAIQSAIQDIKVIGASLQKLVRDYFKGSEVSVQTIQEVLNAFEPIRQSQDSNIYLDALNNLLDSSKSIYHKFIELRLVTEPKIEMNRYLTEKLLHHHQLSYQFWQEIDRESSATYQDDGKQKHKVVSPLLRVKA